MAEDLKVIHLEGSLGIEYAETLRGQVMGQLDAGNSIILNCDRLETLDLAVIQVLLSAKLTAVKRSLSVKIGPYLSQGARKCFTRAGFGSSSQGKDSSIDKHIDEFIAGML